MEKIIELLPLLIPLIIVQFVLVVYALINLKNAPKVKFDNKLIWVLIIVFINIFGPIIYLIAGRDINAEDSSDD